jgi:hypothetical protein
MTLAFVPPIARAVSVCSVNERLAQPVLFRPRSVTAKIRHSGASPTKLHLVSMRWGSAMKFRSRIQIVCTSLQKGIGD